MESLKTNFKDYLEKVLKAFNKTQMRVLPGNLAFFSVLALIPMLTLITFIASRFSISLDSLIGIINNFLPKEASDLIVNAISGKDFDTSIGTFNIITLFVASNGMYAIINASNNLYDINYSDPLKNRIKSVLLLLLLLLLILFLLLVPVFGDKILALFSNTIFSSSAYLVYRIVKWPLSFFLIFLLIKLIYVISPSKKIKSKTTTIGALFTTVCWSIATAVFSYYITYFANYNIIYGNLSSIIILMMWLYIISYVFVLGIAINVVNLNDKSYKINS